MTKFFSRHHPPRPPGESLNGHSPFPQDDPVPFIHSAEPGADTRNPGDDESDAIEKAKSSRFLKALKAPKGSSYED